MPRTGALLGDAGHDVLEQLRELPALLPLAGDVPHRPVHAQPRRARQRAAADGGYARLDHTNTLPVWLRAAGYTHRATSASTSTATAPTTRPRSRPGGPSGTG